MGRPLRIHYDGALFHVISRGNDKQDLFLDDSDRLGFLSRLRRIWRESTFSIYAYCLMTNHVHLLLRVRQESVSAIMHRLFNGYSREFNRKHGRMGHLFEAHPKAIHCATDAYFRELVRYIHMNPVTAGIVDSPERYKWSGYSELTGGARDLLDVPFVESMFGGGPSVCSVIEDFTRRQEDFDLKWVEVDAAGLPEPEAERPPPALIPLENLLAMAAQRHGLPTVGLLGPSKVRVLSAARHEFVLDALRNGHRPCAIARILSRSEAVISRLGANVKKGGES